MVKFVDLEKGFIYDGHKPYIFWFNDGLSTDLIYTKSIGVFSDKLMINISLPSNSVIKFHHYLKNVHKYIYPFQFESLNMGEIYLFLL